MGEWYYTANNKQMGPISWDELKQLASSGLLQPTDMIWKEGMSDWIKASKKAGLFSDRPTSEEFEEDRPTGALANETGITTMTSVRGGAAANRGGMPLGAKVAIIGGSIAVGLLILVVVIVLLLRGGGGAVGGPNVYTVSLGAGRADVRSFRFNAGQNVRITVTTQAPMNPDVDIFIVRSNNFPVASDTRVSKDCFVNFFAPANDTYRVRVVNLGPGPATSTVNVQ